jgi:hypothetical protein
LRANIGIVELCSKNITDPSFYGTPALLKKEIPAFGKGVFAGVGKAGDITKAPFDDQRIFIKIPDIEKLEYDENLFFVDQIHGKIRRIRLIMQAQEHGHNRTVLLPVLPEFV